MVEYFAYDMEKLGRNDPCSCGSGKKFKKCCESKMLRGRYRAELIPPTNRTLGLTSLFHAHVAPALSKAPAPSPEGVTVEQKEGN